MEDHNLLDDAIASQDQSILDMIQWWEKRRLIYNLIIGFAGLFATFIIMNKHSSIAFYHILLYAALYL